ncbi:MAG: HU family DNA-binding protein [Methylococcaceae bacterium]|jgi:DNA-binding protein HU-beta
MRRRPSRPVADSDKTLTLPGSGSFAATLRAARTGHNPKTGEAIKVPARRSPSFKPAKALKDACDAGI